MELKQLLTTPNIDLSYDSNNQWLYLDWHGHLTLDVVRKNCILVAQCFLQHSCRRILNDNTNVLSLTADVSAWLAKEYLPYMHLAQIEYVAWVYSPNLDTHFYTDIALYKHATPIVALFDDLATAYTWLRDVRYKSPSLPLLTPSTQARIELESRISHVLQKASV